MSELGVRWAWGAAAIATLIALVIGTTWLAFYFRGPHVYLHLRPSQWKPRMSEWVGMLKVGLPAGAEFALMSVYMLVVYTVSRPFGPPRKQASASACESSRRAFFRSSHWGSQWRRWPDRTSPHGTGDRVRATFRAGLMMAYALMVAAAAFCVLRLDKPMIGMFSDDPAVVRVGAEYLNGPGLELHRVRIVFVVSSMFQALGNTVPPLATSFGRMCIVAVPVLLLSRAPGSGSCGCGTSAHRQVWLHAAANLLLLQRELRVKLPIVEVV